MKSITITAIVVIVAILVISIAALSFYGQTSTQSTTSSSSSSLQPIPAPSDYLGASFDGSGTNYALLPLSGILLPQDNPGISESSSTGYLLFAFSTSKYSQSDLSVSYASCVAAATNTSNVASSTTTSIATSSMGSGSGG